MLRIAQKPRAGADRILRTPILFVLLAGLNLVSACSNALPKTEITTHSPWENFEDAKAAYDSIEPYQTNGDQLRALGYDPYTSPNVHRLSYLDVVARFLPKDSIQFETLDPGLRSCIDAGSACWAYEVKPDRVKHRREGNALLDIFGFKRTTKTSGWRFSAVVVLKDDLVHYKVWDGTPAIQEEKVVTKPLGPLQEVDEIITHSVAP